MTASTPAHFEPSGRSIRPGDGCDRLDGCGLQQLSSLVFTWSADQRRSTGLHRKVPSSVHSTILRTPHQGELLRFRNDVFDCFSARSDALFDLGDGLCTPVVADCAVTRAPDERGREHQHRGHHSPAPVRRSWSASVTTASTSPARRGALPDRKEHRADMVTGSPARTRRPGTSPT